MWFSTRQIIKFEVVNSWKQHALQTLAALGSPRTIENLVAQQEIVSPSYKEYIFPVEEAPPLESYHYSIPSEQTIAQEDDFSSDLDYQGEPNDDVNSDSALEASDAVTSAAP